MIAGVRKSTAPDIEIVVLTGYGSIATAVEAMRLGARDYLTKPSHADRILAAFETDPEPTQEMEFDIRPWPSSSASTSSACCASVTAMYRAPHGRSAYIAGRCSTSSPGSR